MWVCCLLNIFPVCICICNNIATYTHTHFPLSPDDSDVPSGGEEEGEGSDPLSALREKIKELSTGTASYANLYTCTYCMEFDL